MTAPHERIRPNREIVGMSAILLPFTDAGAPDLAALERHVARTLAAGLVPAVNMDTGYVQAIDSETRAQVLDLCAEQTSEFVAGAFVEDSPGDALDEAAYQSAAAEISRRGGTPVLFPSYGLNALDGAEWVEAQARMAKDWDGYIGFELGPMFAPCGRIYDIDTYRMLLDVPQCRGAKHSSLDRELEWQRLALRDAVRPDFRVLTGNDLAIDMVIYGSDYLLGLSTCAPDAFALRDRFWAEGDPRFYALNDLLQYLGELIFRPPVPSYRHSAAQILKLRGFIDSDAAPLVTEPRPESDVEILRDIATRIEAWL
jgi:dihydrodipicolinate synthase/N-acetylneuraminate lyase